MRAPLLGCLAGLLIAACGSANAAGPAGGNDSGSAPSTVWRLEEGLAQPEKALYDRARDQFYVSNVDGAPDAHDGKGYVSRVSSGGELLERRWIDGLNAPKGMALAGDRLVIADLDRVVVADPESGDILAEHDAPDAEFLNGVAANEYGDAYVADMLGNAIYRLGADGNFELWLQSMSLNYPNGLLVDNGRLIVASWGEPTDGFRTEEPGQLRTVDIGSRAPGTIGAGKPVGNLDGVAALDGSDYLASDWISGEVLRIGSDGSAQTLFTPGAGAADFAYLPQPGLLVLPMMQDNALIAYRLAGTRDEETQASGNATATDQ